MMRLKKRKDNPGKDKNRRRRPLPVASTAGCDSPVAGQCAATGLSEKNRQRHTAP